MKELMGNYKFVTKQAVSSIDIIKNEVKKEILRINDMQGKKKYGELRKQEKDLYQEQT